MTISVRALGVLLVLGTAIGAVAVMRAQRSTGEGHETRPRPPPALSPGGPTDVSITIRPEPNGAAAAQAPTLASRLVLLTPATVLWPVELSPFEARRRTTIPPGTLLDVLTLGEGRATVRLPDATEGYVAGCALTADRDELAIAWALAGTPDAKEAARQAHPGAVLAPLLEGKPPRDVSCAAPAARKGESAAPPDRSPDPRGIEALGLWTRGNGRVSSPSVHDWKRLARTHAAIADDVPLRPGDRQKVRILRQRELAAEGEERMSLGRPSLEYELPAAELRGTYYGFGPAGVERATKVRLRGDVVLSVDCRGCEQEPRSYGGYADPEFGGSFGAAVVLWVAGGAVVEAPRPLPATAWTVAPGKPIEIRLPHPGERAPVVYTLPYHDRGRGDTLDGAPFSIVRAYVTGLPSLGVRLLVVETNGNPACSRGLFLYEVTEGTVRRLGGTDFDCDV